MNRILLTVAAAALAGGFAVAQVQAQVVVTLEPQVRTELREYVVVRGEPAVAVADFDVAVGTVVPETVELRMIEGIPAVAEYLCARGEPHPAGRPAYPRHSQRHGGRCPAG
jgi:hypothetical protein